VTRIAAAALVLFAGLVQLTWAQGLTVLGVFPNLVLVLAIAITWNHGMRAGLACACAGGLLLDLAAPGPLGPHALALLAGAFTAGQWARSVDRASFMQPALAAGVATLVYSLVLVGSDDTLGLPIPPIATAVQLAALAALYNAVVAVPVMLAMRRTRSEVRA
jgi:rod shape-determining protein MreD